MIKQIDGKWYRSNTVWEPLEEPADFEKQKCALFRQGQADRKAGLGILQNWGSYIDGWHNPEKNDGENKFHVIGNDRGYNDYLCAYPDSRNGLSQTEMQKYLNEKVESGWKYVGNISEKFDEAVREMIG